MIERQNYLKIKEHLKYLEEVLQLNPLPWSVIAFTCAIYSSGQMTKIFAMCKPSAPRYPLIWHLFQAKKEREPLQEYPKRKLLTLANASFVGQSPHTREK